MTDNKERVTKRKIGFRAAPEESAPGEVIRIPAALLSSDFSESTAAERTIKDCTDTVVSLLIIFVPVYLGITFSMWWLFLWAWEVPFSVVKLLQRRFS